MVSDRTTFIIDVVCQRDYERLHNIPLKHG